MPSLVTIVEQDQQHMNNLERKTMAMIEPEQEWSAAIEITEGEIGRFVLFICDKEDTYTEVSTYEVPLDIHLDINTEPGMNHDEIRGLSEPSETYRIGKDDGYGDIGVDINGEQVYRLRVRHVGREVIANAAQFAVNEASALILSNN